MTLSPGKYAVTSATNRSIVWAGNADSKEHAISLAVIALDRTRAPASWSAWLISELPADLCAEALAWTPLADDPAG